MSGNTERSDKNIDRTTLTVISRTHAHLFVHFTFVEGNCILLLRPSFCVIAVACSSMFGTDPSCGSAGISHYAVGGSAAALSDLLPLLENWAATAVPKLLTQVRHGACSRKAADIWASVFCAFFF